MSPAFVTNTNSVTLCQNERGFDGRLFINILTQIDPYWLTRAHVYYPQVRGAVPRRSVW